MTNGEFVNGYAKFAGITQDESDKIVRTLFEFLGKCVISDECVKIARFGTFKHKHMAGHTGVHPVTGETFETGPYTLLRFYPHDTIGTKRPTRKTSKRFFDFGDGEDD